MLCHLQGVAPGYLKALDERFQVWYQHMTRESLDGACWTMQGGRASMHSRLLASAARAAQGQKRAGWLVCQSPHCSRPVPNWPTLPPFHRRLQSRCAWT